MLNKVETGRRGGSIPYQFLGTRKSSVIHHTPSEFHVKSDWEDENWCLTKMKKNGSLLMNVKYQTEEICIAAVRSCSEALIHVRRQTDKICREAVRASSTALEHVKDQTAEICFEAYKAFPESFKFVRIESKELYWMLRGLSQVSWSIVIQNPFYATLHEQSSETLASNKTYW